MELGIYNIDPYMRLEQLQAVIMSTLKSELFLNYGIATISKVDVFIFPHAKAGQNRTGRVTFPTRELGQQFVHEFGGASPRRFLGVRRLLIFKETNKSKLYAEGFMQHKTQEYLRINIPVGRGHDGMYSNNLSIRAVQFGWECRDRVYSVEYERSAGPGGGILVFEEQRMRFLVRIREDDKHDRLIVIRASEVIWASAARCAPSGTSIFLALSHSPTFQLETPKSGAKSKLFRKDTGKRSKPRTYIPPRTRLAAFDDDHAAVAEFTAHSIRLLSDAPDARETFMSLCRQAHIRLSDFSYPACQRGLFSQSSRRDYEAWLTGEVWDIAFQVDAIARANILDLQELMRLKPHLKKMQQTHGTSYAAYFIRYLGYCARDTSWYDAGEERSRTPIDLLMKLFVACKKSFVISSALPYTDSETFPCYHVNVTPTRITLSGPFPERNNRVTRQYTRYTSNFLRVSFTDEEGLQYRIDPDVDGRSFVCSRFGSILSRGLCVAGCEFKFLGYSQSGLKQHAVIFMRNFQLSDTTMVTVDSIISGLGIFHDRPYDPKLMYCPARYGARIAQAFTTTEAAVAVEAEEIIVGVDTMDIDKRRSFTDGAGLMSDEMAAAIWTELQSKSSRHRRSATKPDVLQIRCQGAKGTLTRDKTLEGRVILLRPSMIKFDAPHSLAVEPVAVFNKPGRFRLNRPLIMLLEGLKIKGGYDILQSMQETVIQETKDATTSLRGAAVLIEKHGLGGSYKLSSTFLELAKLGVDSFIDGFPGRVLSTAIYHILRDLKYHARIPVSDGYTLVGVADPYSFLKAKEVFACITLPNKDEPLFLEGPIMISRSPTIHPGDVQVAYAIGRPPAGSVYHDGPIKNALVFATKGAIYA